MKKTPDSPQKSKLADLEPIHLFDNSNGMTPPDQEAEDDSDQENLDRNVRANIIQGMNTQGFF